MQTYHIRTLKILYSMPEFGGVHTHTHTHAHTYTHTHTHTHTQTHQKTKTKQQQKTAIKQTTVVNTENPTRNLSPHRMPLLSSSTIAMWRQAP